VFWVQKGKRAKGRKEVRERKGVLGSIAARFKGSMPYGRSEYWVQSSILIMKAGVFPCISALADLCHPCLPTGRRVPIKVLGSENKRESDGAKKGDGSTGLIAEQFKGSMPHRRLPSELMTTILPAQYRSRITEKMK
jgi:hypothetical protein